MGISQHLNLWDSSLLPEKAKGYSGPFGLIETKSIILSILEKNSCWPDDQYEEEFLLSNRKLSEEDKSKLNQRLDKIKHDSKSVVFVPKPPLLVTPESYKQACEILGIPQGSSYALGHKAYKRALSNYHPDRIPQMSKNGLGNIPQRSSISYLDLEVLNSKYESYKSGNINRDGFESFLIDYILDRYDFIESRIENITEEICSNTDAGGKKVIGDLCLNLDEISQLKSEFSDIKNTGNQELLKKKITELILNKYYYGFSVDDFEAIGKEVNLKIDNWKKDYEKNQYLLNELFLKGRESIDKAWEIYQAYNGMPWEQAKDIDIVYGLEEWLNLKFNAILLDNDCIIAKSYFYRGNGPYDDYQLGKFIKKYFDEIPDLKHLIRLLESKNFNKEQIINEAVYLKQKIIKNKPDDFDYFMDEIIKNPGKYSAGIVEHEFTPTLIFGKGKSWSIGMFEQDYEIPLRLLFSHMYLYTTGRIPYRLGEKFIRKYLPDVSNIELSKMLMKIEKLDNNYYLFDEEISELRKELNHLISILKESNLDELKKKEIESKINNLKTNIKGFDDLKYVVDDIYEGIKITQIDDFGELSQLRIGLEVAQDGSVTIYFPLNIERNGNINTSLKLSIKELNTMYMAMLESPILDFKKDVQNRLGYNPS